MRIVTRAEIEQVIDLPRMLGQLCEAYRLCARGAVSQAAVGHLAFSSPPGECHIKAAHLHGAPDFAVKVSTGFYENPARGLPSSNGLVLVFDAQTGEPRALLDDRGLLTDVRTALAAVIAVRLARPAGSDAIGMLGTGTQAELQLRYLWQLDGPFSARVWGRSEAARVALAARLARHGIEAQMVADARELGASCDTLLCATASTAPILAGEWVRPGTHIVASGADAPGKQELDPRLFARAAGVLVDSPGQCFEHGECRHAADGGYLRARAGHRDRSRSGRHALA